jgi:hypothetical protein
MSDFLSDLEEPLGIPKPNKLKIISMNLTICEGYRVHCSDILDALTKNFLGTSDIAQLAETSDMDTIKNERPNSYKPMKTTLEFQRENYCARLVSRNFRRLIAKREAQSRLDRMLIKVRIEEFDDLSDLQEDD